MVKYCRDYNGLTRRDFMKAGAIGSLMFTYGGISAGCMTGEQSLLKDSFSDEEVVFGIVTDIHYADKPTRGLRQYLSGREKLAKVVKGFNERNVSYAINLGDYIDMVGSSDTARRTLSEIDDVFEGYAGDRYHVFGNHDIDELTKEEFLVGSGFKNTTGSYSFDVGSWRFIVLDCNFREDGVEYVPGNFNWDDSCVPDVQLQWLQGKLADASGRKVVVFTHQNIDIHLDSNGKARRNIVKNANEIRAILNEAGNVRYVFSGHHHSGGYQKIDGIGYYTLRALVDNTAPTYSIVALTGDALKLEGFGRQESYSIM